MKPLYRMFTTVPGRYDLMNRLLTLGMDERWRRKVARLVMKQEARRVLDLCTGTGDLAIHFSSLGTDGQEIFALDFSEPMLAIARRKAARRTSVPIQFVHGDVSHLPFHDHSFDAVGIAFAFRNLSFHNPLRDTYLSEIRRVMKPGGQCVIVETSQPRSGLVRYLYHAYLGLAVSVLGGLLSGHRQAYHYLAYSAKHYFDQAQVSELLMRSGFLQVECQPQFLGTITIYLVTK